MCVGIYILFVSLTIIGGFAIQSAAASMIMDTRNASYTFRLRIFDNESSEKPWAFPHTVQITKRIYVEVQLRPINNGIIDDDLLAIPKNCFFSPNSNPTVDTRHMALIEGCTTGKSDVLVHKRNYSSPDHAVRFSLLLDDVYFPTHHFMFFHCSAAVCSQNSSRTKGTTEMCLADNFCDPGAHSAKVPLAPQNQPSHYVHVFSGPMRPVYPAAGNPETDSAPIPAWTVNGSRMRKPLQDTAPAPAVHHSDCPPCPEKPHGDPTATPVPEMVVVTEGGLDTLTVFCIAVGSFAVGVLLMTGLCYVHRITDPKRCSSAKSSRYTTHQTGLLLLPRLNTPFDPDATTTTTTTPSTRIFTPNNSASSSFSSTVASSALLLAAKPTLRLPCCLDGSSPETKGARVSKGHRPQDPMLGADDHDDRYRLKREVDGLKEGKP